MLIITDIPFLRVATSPHRWIPEAHPEVYPQQLFGTAHDVLDHLVLSHPFTPEGELSAAGSMLYRRVFAPFSAAAIWHSVAEVLTGCYGITPTCGPGSTGSPADDDEIAQVAKEIRQIRGWYPGADTFVANWIGKGFMAARNWWGWNRYGAEAHSAKLEARPSLFEMELEAAGPRVVIRAEPFHGLKVLQ